MTCSPLKIQKLAATALAVIAAIVLMTPHALSVGGGGGGEATGPATQTDVILLVAYVLLALIISFVCSVSEAVLLSITPSFIASLKDTRPKTAELVVKLKQDKVDQSLDDNRDSHHFRS